MTRPAVADDIVTRLRVIYCAADDLTPCGTCLPCQAADEIGRLREAGDALAHLMPHAHLSVPCRSPQGTPLDEWCSECAALAAWKKARRG